MPNDMGTADRRLGLRVDDDRPVKVYDARARRYYVGRAVNLGAGGMRLDLPATAPVQTGGTLQVYVGSDEEQEVLISLKNMTPIRIAWVERMASGEADRIIIGAELALLNASVTRQQKRVA